MRTAVSQVATPDFLRTLRVPLLKGRFFTRDDGADAQPVAVVSQSLAHRIWVDRDPVGQRVRFGTEGSQEPWRTVVGVVGDVGQSVFSSEPSPTAYVPFAQLPLGSLTVAMRTSGDPVALAASARAAVRSADPDQPAYDVRTLDQVLSDNESGVAFSARFMMVFGAIALILAAAGIFAVMAYAVRQRTHEIGVRMALGARRVDMFSLVLGRALKLSLIGLAIGMPCALALARGLSSLLLGVVNINIEVFVALAALLALVAGLAAYVPARWATRVDPMVALRNE